jgi:Ca-activated chloride channel homolog
MSLGQPIWFWIFLAVALVATGFQIFCMLRIVQQSKAIKSECFTNVKNFLGGWQIPFLLFLAGCVVLGVAFSEPYKTKGDYQGLKQGIDVMILLDVSSSMLAEDFKPNRLEAAKKTIQSFSEKLINDRVGLIVYSGEAYIQYPLSFDHHLMAQFLSFVKSGFLKPGTAIGDALAHGVQRLKQSESKKRSRILILLTDGDHNAGTITPDQAAQLAKDEGIPIYSIAIGKQGQVPHPVYLRGFGGTQRKTYQMVQSRVNTELLEKIATTTGGEFYKVDESGMLASVFSKIQKIEKSKLPEIKPRTEIIYYDVHFLWLAFILLAASFLSELFWIRWVIV